MYFVEGVGYVSGQFEKNGIKYPKNWLRKLNDEKLAALGAVKQPEYNYETEVLEKSPTGWVVRNKTEEELLQDANNKLQEAALLRESLVANAWEEANELSKQLDENSRASILWLFAQPDLPEWRRERIIANQNWWSNLWLHYGAVKGQILNGLEAAFNKELIGDCPYTIWEIMEE